MRTLVMIYTEAYVLHQIMERAKVTKEDTLIFLGDYVDGFNLRRFSIT
jgi:serine/threonine protein phosphatase 1